MFVYFHCTFVCACFLLIHVLTLFHIFGIYCVKWLNSFFEQSWRALRASIIVSVLQWKTGQSCWPLVLFKYWGLKSNTNWVIQFLTIIASIIISNQTNYKMYKYNRFSCRCLHLVKWKHLEEEDIIFSNKQWFSL